MFSYWNILLLLCSLVLSIQSEEFTVRYHNKVANLIKEVESKTNSNLDSSIVDAHEYIKKLYQTFYRQSDPRGLPGAKISNVVHSYIANCKHFKLIYYFQFISRKRKLSTPDKIIALRISNTTEISLSNFRRQAHLRTGNVFPSFFSDVGTLKLLDS